MDESEPPLIAEPAEASQAPDLVEDLRQLVSDGRTLLEAELAYQKSRAAVAGQAAKSVAGWGALALALVFFALMGLVIGLVLGLSELLGPWGAMLASFALLLAGAALAALIAARRWKRASVQLAETEQTP